MCAPFYFSLKKTVIVECSIRKEIHSRNGEKCGGHVFSLEDAMYCVLKRDVRFSG